MIKRILKSDGFRLFVSWLITQYVRLAWATGRWSAHGDPARFAKWDTGQPFIMAMWHGRILMMAKGWRRGAPFYMLASQHRDGQLIARAIAPFGISYIMGSTAKPGKAADKGGMAAVREILRTLKAGGNIGITPDGPRGPRMRATEGVVTIARLSGVPIIPVAWSARRRWALNSWDRFLVPKLFTTGVFVWGAPIHVPRDADDVQCEAFRLTVESALTAVTDEADRMVGATVIEPAPIAARGANA